MGAASVGIISLMPRRLFFSLAISLLTGCAATPTHPPADTVLRLRIIFLDAGRIVEASAVVADASGLVFTPRHLIEGADVLDVALPGHQHGSAEMIYEDQAADVAVLWVEGADLPGPPRWNGMTSDHLTVVGPDGASPVTVAADHTLHLPTASGEQGGKLLVDPHGNAVGMVVDRDKNQLTIVTAATLTALRDLAIREANAGRATPFSPGSVHP